MFIDLYNTVFDSSGNVKLCGRDSCRMLIEACIDRFPDVNFGNKETGFMNIKNIKRYAR